MDDMLYILLSWGNQGQREGRLNYYPLDSQRLFQKYVWMRQRELLIQMSNVKVICLKCPNSERDQYFLK